MRKEDADKRANLVQISPKGRKAVVEISRLRKKIAQSFFGNLKEDQAGAIVDLLRKALTVAVGSRVMSLRAVGKR